MAALKAGGTTSAISHTTPISPSIGTPNLAAADTAQPVSVLSVKAADNASPADAGPRVRKPKAHADEISIMTVVFGKGWGKPFTPGGGGTHTDVQEGDNVWNAKKGWNIYGAYGPRARMGGWAFKPVDVTKPKEAVMALFYNAALKPFNRFVLKLTPEQKETMRKYLYDRKDQPKGLLHTCVNATSAMLKEVLGVEPPMLARQSPTAFARWMKAQAKEGAPWIERMEAVGEIKSHHFYMGAVKNVAVLGAVGTGGAAIYGIFRAASWLLGDKDESKDKEKPDKNDVFELIAEEPETAEK